MIYYTFKIPKLVNIQYVSSWRLIKLMTKGTSWPHTVQNIWKHSTQLHSTKLIIAKNIHKNHFYDLLTMPSLIQSPHSPNDSFTNALIHSMTPFTQWLIQPMALFTNAFIHSMSHSPNDSFTNAPFTQWLIHQCPIHPMTHSLMPSFNQWPIHQCLHSFYDPFSNGLIHLMTHSPKDSIHQCPHSFNDPFTQWLIQPMLKFTMCSSGNKERGSDCSMQHASTPAHMCEEVAATDLWCRALCLQLVSKLYI